MRPIICPNCQTVVIPHETHKQRLHDCYHMIADDELFNNLTEDNKIRLIIDMFNELNDFTISENIEKSKMKTTQQIQAYKRENIKKFGEQ